MDTKPLIAISEIDNAAGNISDKLNGSSEDGKPMTRIFILVAALMLAICGCNISADTSAAEQAVPRFHALLDAARYAEIYEKSSDDLKKATSQKDLLALLEAVHRKLGKTKSSEQQGWKVNHTSSGSFVILNYKTSYAEGDATEQFVFRLEDKVALLAGYHINSNALILK